MNLPDEKAWVVSALWGYLWLEGSLPRCCWSGILARGLYESGGVEFEINAAMLRLKVHRKSCVCVCVCAMFVSIGAWAKAHITTKAHWTVAKLCGFSRWWRGLNSGIRRYFEFSWFFLGEIYIIALFMPFLNLIPLPNSDKSLSLRFAFLLILIVSL